MVVTTLTLTNLNVSTPLSTEQSSATALLLYRLTGKDVYKNDIEAYMTSWENRPRTPKGACACRHAYHYTFHIPEDLVNRNIQFQKNINKTGLAFFSPWGSNRYTANTAFVAFMAAEYGLNPEDYRAWAKKQVC